MTNWQRLWRWTAVTCTLALLAFVGVAWFVAGALVAPANRQVGPAPGGYGIESVTIRSDSGSGLAAWYIPRHGATATVVLFHPIRSDRRAMLGRAKLFHHAGYATLLVDLQAHGESPGENITAGYRERLDVSAAVNFVRTRHPAHRIGIVGWSLGGAAALLGSPLKIDALALESVYPTLQEAVHNRISLRMGMLSHILTPTLLVQLQPRLGISPSQLCPIDHIQDVGCPLLIAAGDCDDHTTLSETQRLYQTAPEPKQLVIFEGAAHTDLLTYDPDKYHRIVAFFDRYLTDKGRATEGGIMVTEQRAGHRAVDDGEF
ncbi:MAG: alpha/beta hydrolase [Planctomycetales bacterium]|nr:alpha/beta hydrolase [Planctomycetales bacterium]